jgi:hypothetical protein
MTESYHRGRLKKGNVKRPKVKTPSASQGEEERSKIWKNPH